MFSMVFVCGVSERLSICLCMITISLFTSSCPIEVRLYPNCIFYNAHLLLPSFLLIYLLSFIPWSTMFGSHSIVFQLSASCTVFVHGFQIRSYAFADFVNVRRQRKLLRNNIHIIRLCVNVRVVLSCSDMCSRFCRIMFTIMLLCCYCIFSLMYMFFYVWGAKLFVVLFLHWLAWFVLLAIS